MNQKAMHACRKMVLQKVTPPPYSNLTSVEYFLLPKTHFSNAAVQIAFIDFAYEF